MEACLCKTCENKTCFNAGFVTQILKCRAFAPPKSTTNYDLFVRKSPEELAEFMADQSCPPGEDLSECCFGKPEPPSKKTCTKCWLDWLKLASKKESTND